MIKQQAADKHEQLLTIAMVTALIGALGFITAYL
ncbi:hypothetical protein Ga0123461_0612 [Mariprofundus aestuarium]|uniref:Uncharacterized protein n=1 Tax=Mariprofundus aestuarium TaxID=1921086 RepID=A0A2K8KWK1_MARES|nr:hypothetical protein Ga0123461_0612 [Mariprofundus aestuarium]